LDNSPRHEEHGSTSPELKDRSRREEPVSRAHSDVRRSSNAGHHLTAWKRKTDAGRLRFAILKPISNNIKGYDFSLCHCTSRETSISKDSGQLRHRNNPTTVDFLFAHQPEIHTYLQAEATVARSRARALLFLPYGPATFPEIRLTVTSRDPRTTLVRQVHSR
jgi:hypothetical protein